MKRIITLLLFVLVFGNFISAQTPQSINYQAVVRGSSGSPLATTPVVLRFTIHDGSASGATLYTETSSQLTTNQFGLVNTTIGQSANLGVVSWGVNTKWLQVEVNVNNAGFTNMGTQQLVSVPYALYAKNVEMDKDSQILSISGNNLTISNGNTVTLPSSNTSTGTSLYDQQIELGFLSLTSSGISCMTSNEAGTETYLILNDVNGFASTLVWFEKDGNGVLHYMNSASFANIAGATSIALIGNYLYVSIKATTYLTTPTIFRFDANTFANQTSMTVNPSFPASAQGGYGYLFPLNNNLYVQVSSGTSTQYKKYNIISTALIDANQPFQFADSNSNVIQADNVWGDGSKLYCINVGNVLQKFSQTGVLQSQTTSLSTNLATNYGLANLITIKGMRLLDIGQSTYFSPEILFSPIPKP